MKRFTFLSTLLAIPASIFGFKHKNKPDFFTVIRNGNDVKLFKNGELIKPKTLFLGQSNALACNEEYKERLDLFLKGIHECEKKYK